MTMDHRRRNASWCNSPEIVVAAENIKQLDYYRVLTFGVCSENRVFFASQVGPKTCRRALAVAKRQLYEVTLW